jgi:uncharacterized Zn-binding protein involved in type VI secretion
MRIPVVKFGDPTTTGGEVLAFKARLHDKGKKLALDGEHATCGNCKGSWPMFGTGNGISNQGTQVVIDGDDVLCPCGENRVIASADARYFIHKHPDASKTSMAEPSRESPIVTQYDEQFTLLDEARRPLENVRYRIVVGGERVIAGLTDANGKIERVATPTASSLKLQLGK